MNKEMRLGLVRPGVGKSHGFEALLGWKARGRLDTLMDLKMRRSRDPSLS